MPADPVRGERDDLRARLTAIRGLAEHARRLHGPRSATAKLAAAVLAVIEDTAPAPTYRQDPARSGARVFLGEEEIGFVAPVRRPGRAWGARPDGYTARDMTGRAVSTPGCRTRGDATAYLVAAWKATNR